MRLENYRNYSFNREIKPFIVNDYSIVMGTVKINDIRLGSINRSVRTRSTGSYCLRVHSLRYIIYYFCINFFCLNNHRDSSACDRVYVSSYLSPLTYCMKSSPFACRL